MKYINLFDTQAAYDAAEKYYPNVSYIEATDEVVYQEIDPTLMVAKFTTTFSNQSVLLTYHQEYFSKITVDDQEQTVGTGVMHYTFATADEHEVVYKLVDSTTIGMHTFYSCRELTSIEIPNSVTSISESVFQSCTGLTSIAIPDSVTTIGINAFNGCYHLTSLTIGNSVTTLGRYAFSGCYGLTSVIIPNSVTTIDWEVFYNCSGLTSMTIGNSVTSIGTKAISCANLVELTSLATTPPRIDTSTFLSVPSDCAIYVPAESVEAYKAAQYWSTRANYIQAIQ